MLASIRASTPLISFRATKSLTTTDVSLIGAAESFDGASLTMGERTAADGVYGSSSLWQRVAARIVNALAGALFLACAVLQYNDPDPYVWIPIYAVPCLLSMVLTVRPSLVVKPLFACLMAFHLAVCISALGYLSYAPRVSLNWAEESMEAIGLLLTIGWIAGHLMHSDVASRTKGFTRPCLLSGCLLCLMSMAGVPLAVRLVLQKCIL